MAEPIRILIADDHPTLRAGLRAILETQDDLRVAAEAATGVEAVARAAAFTPDVVLMDLEMPELDGVEATRRIREQTPATRVIVFTAFDTDERVIAAIEAGAHGYLLKGAPRDEIFRALRLARSGGAVLQPAIAAKLLRHAAAPRRTPAHETLTERELQALALLVGGLTNKEIAARLYITERTAKFHVAAILAKLDAPNRAAAVRVAIERGLVGRQMGRDHHA